MNDYQEIIVKEYDGETLFPMKIRVEKTNEKIEMSKRCYLPLIIKYICPFCKMEREWDLQRGNYLSYPTTNLIENVSVFCNECDKDFTFSIKLNVSVDLFDIGTLDEGN